jgi:hypothetical protein
LAFRCYNTLDAVLAVDNSCVHGLEVPKPPLCKDPTCLAVHAKGLGRAVHFGDVMEAWLPDADRR